MISHPNLAPPLPCIRARVFSCVNSFFMLVISLALALLPLVQAAKFKPLDPLALSSAAIFEQFVSPDWDASGWTLSLAIKDASTAYDGKWTIEPASKYAAYEDDYALTMASEANFFAVSKLLDEPFEMGDGDLVVQYEVKYNHGVTCGGAYIKLLSQYSPQGFSEKVPYEVMFGPDICGSQNRVLFYIKREKGNAYFHSKLRTPPMARTGELSTLYTLVLKSNYNMEIRINGEVAKAGNLLNSPNFMEPPLSPPQYTIDVSATKPDDWDDRRYIFDEDVKKPEDYDRLHNTMWIPDPSVKKPEGWNDDESIPTHIPDPKAVKPEEWLDEEDGEWRAPQILNPACANGCGKWEAPKIINPEYKGEWVPPVKENPDYMGEWKPPLVENPNYLADRVQPMAPIKGIGFESWSMDSGVQFNNIYVGSSVAEAERIGNQTFVPKSESEHAKYKANRPRAKHEPQQPPKSFDDILDEGWSATGLLNIVPNAILDEFKRAQAHWAEFQELPLDAVTKHPLRFAVYCFLFVVVFTFTFGIINVMFFLFLDSRQPQPTKAATKKEAETEEPEETEEEVIAQITGKATGVESKTSATTKIR